MCLRFKTLLPTRHACRTCACMFSGLWPHCLFTRYPGDTPSPHFFHTFLSQGQLTRAPGPGDVGGGLAAATGDARQRGHTGRASGWVPAAGGEGEEGEGEGGGGEGGGQRQMRDSEGTFDGPVGGCLWKAGMRACSPPSDARCPPPSDAQCIIMKKTHPGDPSHKKGH